MRIPSGTKFAAPSGMKTAVLFLICTLSLLKPAMAQPVFADTSLNLGKIAQGARIEFEILVSNPNSESMDLKLEHICGCTEFAQTDYTVDANSSLKIPIIYHSSGNAGDIQRGFYVNYASGKQKISFNAFVDSTDQFVKPILDSAVCYAFQRTTIDCGNITEGAMQQFTFIVNNCSLKPLTIATVNSSCGCVTPSWSSKPIPSGGEGEIIANFNSSGRPGTFQKTLTVYLMNGTSGKPLVLTIKGNVIAKK
jgi:hypothetical protein